MIKKIYLSFLLLLGSTFFVSAQIDSPVCVTMQIIKKGDASNSGTKMPPLPLTIIQDGHELIIPSFDNDLTLELCDINDAVVYTLSIPAGTTQITLPSTFSGTFGLYLYVSGSSYYYYGYINL